MKEWVLVSTTNLIQILPPRCWRTPHRCSLSWRTNTDAPGGGGNIHETPDLAAQFGAIWRRNRRDLVTRDIHRDLVQPRTPYAGSPSTLLLQESLLRVTRYLLLPEATTQRANL